MECMGLTQGNAGQYRLSRICAMHGVSLFCYSGVTSLSWSRRLYHESKHNSCSFLGISHIKILVYTSWVVLHIPLLLLSGCYKLSAFTGRLSKHCIENNFLFQFHQCAVTPQAVILARLHQEPLCTMHSVHPTCQLSMKFVQDSLVSE